MDERGIVLESAAPHRPLGSARRGNVTHVAHIGANGNPDRTQTPEAATKADVAPTGEFDLFVWQHLSWILSHGMLP
jgi:hypothetical protein